MALWVKLQPLMHGVRPDYPHLIHPLKPPLEGRLQSDFRPSAKNAKRGLDNATLAFSRPHGSETPFLCAVSHLLMLHPMQNPNILYIYIILVWASFASPIDPDWP
jgi:hypothetical protein